MALYIDVERNTMFVREADEAVRIFTAERDAYLALGDKIGVKRLAQVVAVDGSYAPVIGGEPAAAVVFGSEVRKRTELELLRTAVRAEAGKFDRIHSIERARKVRSVDRIVSPGELRRYLVEAVERGIRRTKQAQGPRAHRRRLTPTPIAGGPRAVTSGQIPSWATACP